MPQVVVTKFWVPSCPGCTRIESFFDELKIRYPDVEFRDYNFKDNRWAGPKYKLTKMPCIVVESGEKFECVSGVLAPEVYTGLIDKFIKDDTEGDNEIGIQ